MNWQWDYILAGGCGAVAYILATWFIGWLWRPRLPLKPTEPTLGKLHQEMEALSAKLAATLKLRAELDRGIDWAETFVGKARAEVERTESRAAISKKESECGK